jgi:acyl-CoA thioester hydrolase
MQEFYYTGQVIWSQVDANQHMRHSAYADFAAQARVELLDLMGLSAKYLHAHKIGPVLLKEELTYYKEVNLSERIKVSCELISCKLDASRWRIRHEIFKQNGVKAADVFVEGAWIDTVKRKLTALEGELLEIFMQSPKSKDFFID